MANGRLGYSTIPPYSSCVVYNNNSGSSASISINSQVISSSGNTELTVGIGSTTSIVTSGITTVATGATFNTIIGPSFSCSGSFTYCGVFDASQCNYFTNEYIASSATGIGTTTAFIDPLGYCCRSSITGEIINPALRLGECAFAGISSSNLMGIYPTTCGNTCLALTHTEYTSKDANAAGILLTNPYCTCCAVLTCDVFNCNISGGASFGVAYDWYAIKCGYGMCCTSTTARFCNGIIALCEYTPSGLLFYSWSGCCNSTQCTFNSGSAVTCNVFGAQLSACWSTASAGCCYTFAPYCGMTCCAFMRGVNLAGSGGVGAIILNLTGTPQRYSFFPMSYNLTCDTSLGNWVNWFYGCSTGFCGSGLINLCVNTRANVTYGIKWLSYNPSVDCVYFMLDDTTFGGIYSVNKSNLYSHLCKNRAANCFPTCCGYICDMTCYFTKVSNIPSVFSSSDLTCNIRNIYKTAENSWGIAIRNCAGTCFDTFISNDLINWTKTTSTYAQRFETDNSKLLCTSAACNCIVLSCNCFFGNVSCSGITDYKVSTNNYERTGVVISNGESVVVNNNSCYTMNAQVWGYEG